jgi:MSHA biogenesis protein MshJ
MKALLMRWKQLEARYLTLTRRERLLVAAAVAFGPLFILNTLLLEPLEARKRNLNTALSAQQRTLTDMQGQVFVLQQQLQNDPDAAKRTELDGLIAERAVLDGQISAFKASLVRPAEMNGLLEGLLSRQPGLRLVSLKTLAPKSIRPAPVVPPAQGAAPQPAPTFDLFRHGMEIRIEGNYSDLLAYLVHLEQLNAKLLWGELDYQVLEMSAESPKAEMTLTVYTLSTDSAWLSL